MNQIEVWFLIVSLFLPRIALLVAWATSSIPVNSVPFIGDLLLAAFIPRLLVLIYIGGNPAYGMTHPWFWVHVIAWVVWAVIGSLRAQNSTSK